MRKTSLQIKLTQEEMGNAEKKIADWILQNPGALVPLSISELAEKCGTSDATVVRFARRLGFSGYQELKISLAREAGKSEISECISPDDSCMEMFDKVSNDIYCSLEMTKKALCAQDLEKAAEKIATANRIAVYGLGNSAAIAIDTQHKFLRLGFNIAAYCDNHMQAISASHLADGDVALGISHSGSSRDIVEALSIARSHGATTIAVTSKGKSPIVGACDLVLCTDSPETKYSILGLNSRIAQLAIVNALYYYSVCKQKKSMQAIEMTERSLQNKKY